MVQPEGRFCHVIENKDVNDIVVLYAPYFRPSNSLNEGKGVPTTEILFSISRLPSPT